MGHIPLYRAGRAVSRLAPMHLLLRTITVLSVWQRGGNKQKIFSLGLHLIWRNLDY